MNVELTFENGSVVEGQTSDSGFLIEFAEWPDKKSRPANGSIFQTQVSKIKYWQEYDLEKSPDA